MSSKAKMSVDNVTVAWYLCSFTNIMYEAEVTGNFRLPDPYLHNSDEE
jgi:hypothetical protein